MQFKINLFHRQILASTLSLPLTERVKITRKKGFSLIELMLAVSILVILFTMGTRSFLKEQRTMEFEIITNEVKNMLYEARENSSNFKDNFIYGVLLEQSGTTLFRGSSYTMTWADLSVTFPNFITLTDIALNGSPNSVVFDKNTGKTNNEGNFKVQSADGENIVFEINSTWFINTTYNAS